MLRRRVAPLRFAVAAAILIAALACLVVATVVRDEQLFIDRTAGLLIVGGCAAAALLALAGWAADRRRLAGADERSHARVREALATERRWNRELHAKLTGLHANHTPLADPDDARGAVLHAAMTLLEADKGLLLCRDDGDGDGNLDVVCATGFEHDPEPSALVQRLGERVLNRDETLRDDDAATEATPADAEIENLVAIPIYLRDEFDGVVVCANREGGFADFEDEVLLALGDHASAVLGSTRLRGQLRAAYLSTVRALADAIEAKDPAVRTHSEEVSRYVVAVARRLELDPQRQEELLFGSLLHDVGKIGISERILLKPGRLTADEFAAIKLHPRIGHRLVAGIPALAPIAPAVLHHHERFDGGGYPSGLAGERIPLEARIIGVADSFSAMTARRPYSDGMPVADACAELERCAGTQFDPEVVRLFVDEVRGDPPATAGTSNGLATALQDPELDAHRNGAEVIGGPAFSLVDSLTLLFARRQLHELAEAQVRRSAMQDDPCSVVVAELRDLATINRRDGFAAGDRALELVADAVRRAEVRTGAVGCRMGGRRFALVVAGGGAAAARAAVAVLTEELDDDGPACAFGVAACQTGDDGEALIARARAGLRDAVSGAP